MENLKCVFLDLRSVNKDDLDLSELRACVGELITFDHTSEDDVIDAISTAQVVISNKVCLTNKIISHSPDLRLICVCATGTNNIDLSAAKSHGVLVSNARHYATPSVVQHAFMLILNLATHFPQYSRAIWQGQWQQSEQFCLLDFPINELTGKTLGIIGYGELGKGMAYLAKSFGMRVLIAERFGKKPRRDRVAFEAVVSDSDVLSIHCPLTPETQNLIGTRELTMMKPDALLINTARGGIVDEQALALALKQGQIGGAGIDVLSEEPPVSGNPLLDPTLPNLIVTPHIAWASRQARQRLVQEVVLNILAFSHGKPRNLV